MAIKLIEIQCPHVKEDLPFGRHVAWSFILGDDHRLTLCRECMDQIVGAWIQGTIKDGFRAAIPITAFARKIGR